MYVCVWRAYVCVWRAHWCCGREFQVRFAARRRRGDGDLYLDLLFGRWGFRLHGGNRIYRHFYRRLWVLDCLVVRPFPDTLDADQDEDHGEHQGDDRPSSRAKASALRQARARSRIGSSVEHGYDDSTYDSNNNAHDSQLRAIALERTSCTQRHRTGQRRGGSNTCTCKDPRKRGTGTQQQQVGVYYIHNVLEYQY